MPTASRGPSTPSRPGATSRRSADFDRAIDVKKPPYFGALSGRGETYRLMRRYEEALADFDRAIDLDPRIRVDHC